MTIAFVTIIAIAAASSAAPLPVLSVIEWGLGFVRELAPLQAGQGETRSAALARLASALPAVVAVSTTDGVPEDLTPCCRSSCRTETSGREDSTMQCSWNTEYPGLRNKPGILDWKVIIQTGCSKT